MVYFESLLSACHGDVKIIIRDSHFQNGNSYKAFQTSFPMYIQNFSSIFGQISTGSM